MTVELNALAVLYPGYLLLCGLLPLLQELDGRPRQELQATLHRTDLQIGTALRAVPELQVFHFHRLPGFKGGFLLRADFHAANGVGAFPLVSPHIFQFVRVPVPADEHGDLLAAFRVFDFSDAAQVASALQVALFLLGEPVFMERALQQFLVLLHAVQLGYYRAVLCLIERELDIGRFEVEAAHRSRNGVGVAGLVATHHPVEVLRVFQGVGGDADFFQVLPVDFCRVEAVALLELVEVGLRNSKHFSPLVTLRCGVAVVVLDCLCVPLRLGSLDAEQFQPGSVLILAEEIGNEVAEHIAVLVHLHELAAVCRRHGLQIALLVDTLNGTHLALLFIQDQQHVFFLPLCGRGHSVCHK